MRETVLPKVHARETHINKTKPIIIGSFFLKNTLPHSSKKWLFFYCKVHANRTRASGLINFLSLHKLIENHFKKMSGIIHQKNSLRRVSDSKMGFTHGLEPPGIASLRS